MKRLSNWLLVLLMCLAMVVPMAGGTAEAEEGSGKIYVIPLENNVEKGLSAYLERTFQEAEDLGADLIIIEMDTPGGRVDAAQDIKQVIYNTTIPTIALVKDQAISAGAYIALACDEIAMQPGSTIGDAEMLVGGEKADEKYLSAWREEFGALAEAKGRDPMVAKAFVDRDMVIPNVVEAGKLLTLSPQRALDLGMADYLVADRDELLTVLGFDNWEIISGVVNPGEKVTRFLTDPLIAPVLLSFGIICLVLEFFTPGIGIFAVLGISLLGLYFGGHMVAGMASWLAMLLFILGIILCAIEIFVPGFGIFGIFGVVSVIGSIFLTTPDVETAVRYSVIVLGIMLIMTPVILKLMSKGKVFDRLTVKETLTTEKGFTARKPLLEGYVGQSGKALTVLRPSGTVELADGTRLDVVTQGDFINQGDPVQVIAIDGTWLVVQKID